jgi:hypothetical protein
MIKKKSTYKEDNIKRRENPKRSESNSEAEVVNITTTRGRQLSGKISPNYKKGDSSTCESKSRFSNRNKLGNSKKVLQNPHSRKKNQDINEEYESSDSVNSIKQSQIKNYYENEKPYDSKNLNLTKKIIDNNSSSEENDDSLVLAYQENFINEIERILVDVINSHINPNNQKNQNNVLKYEKHVRHKFLI